MRPQIALSTDDNDHYLFFTPITAYIWQRLGFESIIFTMSEEHERLKIVRKYTEQTFIGIKPIKGYKNSTVIQASRLYAGMLVGSYTLMGDIDMLPLCDYFYRDFDKINVFGADLLKFEQYPMCYIGMYGDKWREVMKYRGNIQQAIEADLKDNLPENCNDFDQYWFYDQKLITAKLKGFPINHIHRGYRGSYPTGRVDRGDWEGTLNQPGELIDAHLLRTGYHPEYFEKTMSLIKRILPNENLSWIYDYHKEYTEAVKRAS